MFYVFKLNGKICHIYDFEPVTPNQQDIIICLLDLLQITVAVITHFLILR